MSIPNYDFSNQALDYNEVESVTKQMYSFIVHRGRLQHNYDFIEQKLRDISVIFSAMDYDKTVDLTRYKKDVKTAFLMLRGLNVGWPDFSYIDPIATPTDDFDRIDGNGSTDYIIQG